MNHEELKALSPCRKGMDFAARHKTLAAAWDACERPDWMIWLARKKGWLTKEQSVRISIGAAEAVIGIYAAKYPTDDRPQKAIAAAKAWLVDPHAAAYAAAAADDAYDAYADAAANAAADAANAAAAAAAAYAAAYAADDADVADDAYDAYAADAAAAAAAAYAAYAVRTKTLARMAKIVRKHYPTPPRMR